MPSSFAPKGWGASDASPLIDSESGIFIWPTESGVIYRGMLNDQNHPPYEQYKYSIADHPRQGIESSPSAYRNLGYFSDNAGNVLCLDLLNMKPRWHFFNSDDSDASPVLEIENDIPYIYVGNEVDQQGSSGKAYLRKLNGLTGKTEWEYERICYSVTKPRTNNGGMLTTPSVGRNKTEGLIWTIFSRVDTLSRGSFVCLNTQDGKIKYEIPLSSYSWASPIALYDKEGNSYIYFTDVGGSMYLIYGETGEIIYRNNTGEIFESSPVAIGNRIIQPARGDKIFSFIIQ
jgi:outer membrane protein assembly factor BamB